MKTFIKILGLLILTASSVFAAPDRILLVQSNNTQKTGLGPRIVTSGGTSSSNQVPALNSSGVIDSSMLAATATVPAGVIFDWAGGTNYPSGYLPCDGSSITTNAYPSLFAAIGYNWGGSGANFALPDTRNRFAIGASTNISNIAYNNIIDPMSSTNGNNIGTNVNFIVQTGTYLGHTHLNSTAGARTMQDGTEDPATSQAYYGYTGTETNRSIPPFYTVTKIIKY